MIFFTPGVNFFSKVSFFSPKNYAWTKKNTAPIATLEQNYADHRNDLWLISRFFQITNCFPMNLIWGLPQRKRPYPPKEGRSWDPILFLIFSSQLIILDPQHPLSPNFGMQEYFLKISTKMMSILEDWCYLCADVWKIKNFEISEVILERFEGQNVPKRVRDGL